MGWARKKTDARGVDPELTMTLPTREQKWWVVYSFLSSRSYIEQGGWCVWCGYKVGYPAFPSGISAKAVLVLVFLLTFALRHTPIGS